MRERRLDQGWPLFQPVPLARYAGTAETGEYWPRLDRLWASLKTPAPAPAVAPAPGTVPGRNWNLPRPLKPKRSQWDRLDALLRDLAAAVGPEKLTAAEFLAWLQHGAEKVLLPGPGVQEAGIQVLGLLEMRGLDFSRVFCLGMNSGAFPPPPRLAAPAHRRGKARRPGGYLPSQHEFSRELYDTLLGVAPDLVLTRPQVADDEARVGSPLYPGPWEPREMAVLSKPDPAWLRSPGGPGRPGRRRGGLSRLRRRPAVPENPVRDLREPGRHGPGLPLPLSAGNHLKAQGTAGDRGGPGPPGAGRPCCIRSWPRLPLNSTSSWRSTAGTTDRAQEVLADAAQQVLGDLLNDLHWQAELERWLGETDRPQPALGMAPPGAGAL